MKKFSVIIILVVLIVSLCGCNAVKTVSEKADNATTVCVNFVTERVNDVKDLAEKWGCSIENWKNRHFEEICIIEFETRDGETHKGFVVRPLDGSKCELLIEEELTNNEDLVDELKVFCEHEGFEITNVIGK